MFGPLAKCYEGIEVRDQPVDGDVLLRFHTYHGLLAFFVQTPHTVYASPADAELLLDRLHRFNVTWGMFAAGAAFVPILSYFNRKTQRKSIRSNALRVKARKYVFDGLDTILDALDDLFDSNTTVAAVHSLLSDAEPALANSQHVEVVRKARLCLERILQGDGLGGLDVRNAALRDTDDLRRHLARHT